MEIEHSKQGGLGDWIALNVLNVAALFIQHMEHLHTFVQIIAGLAVVAMNATKAYRIWEERQENKRSRNKDK